MKKLLLLLILISSCSRPLYIKDKHFTCAEKVFVIDTDLKELVYLSLKRAVVVEKDIQEYSSIWNKQRIYIASEYYTEIKKNKTLDKLFFSNTPDKLDSLSFDDFPYKIENVRFCIKSRKELQKIANKTWEDFLHINFELIKIKDNKATIKINNTWIVSNKHPNKSYLSGGGYIVTYEKINGKWQFIKIMSRWIS